LHHWLSHSRWFREKKNASRSIMYRNRNWYTYSLGCQLYWYMHLIPKSFPNDWLVRLQNGHVFHLHYVHFDTIWAISHSSQRNGSTSSVFNRLYSCIDDSSGVKVAVEIFQHFCDYLFPFQLLYNPPLDLFHPINLQ